MITRSRFMSSRLAHTVWKLDFNTALKLVLFTNMSALSYRTECTIMSLAAAIQVMWAFQVWAWESECGSPTVPASQPAKVRPRPARCTTEHSSQSVFISMWPRVLAVWTRYGCSPWETTCCISEFCPSKAPLPKRFRHSLPIELTLTTSLWGDGFCRAGPERQSELLHSLLGGWLEAEGGVPWSLLSSDWTGGGSHPKHSSVFSAVIREFKHSTSLFLQDDTSLNSLSTRHLSPEFTSSSSESSTTSTVCVRTPTGTTCYCFLYAALFVDIL